jgi:hypothetical protein
LAIPFKDKHKELYKKYEPKVTLREGTEMHIKYMHHFDDWGYIQGPFKFIRPGQIFLYQSVYYNDKVLTIDYPKIGIYLHTTPVDQTVEIEWAEYRRNWEFNRQFEYTFEDKTYSADFYEIDTRINRLVLWFDDLLVYGLWDKLPTWKELKPYYEQTWWYNRTLDEKRDIQLQRILNNEQQK